MLKLLKKLALFTVGGLVLFLAFGAFLTVFNKGTGPAPVKQVVVNNKLLDPWPFTVEYVTFRCRMPMGRGEGALTVIAPNGREFGLNGFAISDRFQPIDAIWKDSVEIAGTKVNIGPAFKIAQGLCLANGEAAKPLKVTPETLKTASQFEPAK